MVAAGAEVECRAVPTDKKSHGRKFNLDCYSSEKEGISC